MPLFIALLTHALMQAFIPGASPPLVKIAIFFISLFSLYIVSFF